jgi:hypothetical protein
VVHKDFKDARPEYLFAVTKEIPASQLPLKRMPATLSALLPLPLQDGTDLHQSWRRKFQVGLSLFKERFVIEDPSFR